MTYVTSFSAGFGPIPWLMMGEIFPGRIRGAAASIATAFNWTCTFIVTKSFMDLQVSLPTNSPLMVGIESTVAGFNLLGEKSENCHFSHFCELQHKVGQKDPNNFEAVALKCDSPSEIILFNGPFVQFFDESEKCTFNQAGHLQIFAVSEKALTHIVPITYLPI